MIGIFILFVVLGMEIGLTIYSLRTKAIQKDSRHLLRLAAFGVLMLLILFNVVQWGFQWLPLIILFLIQSLFSMFYFVKKHLNKGKANLDSPSKPFTKRRIITATLGRCLLLTLVIFPAILFPQYEPLAVTGPHSVRTESYTLADPNRIEGFSDTGDHRKVTVQFWYPETTQANETYPLVIFSHGSFGFRGSNYSTFMELASNGYVVGSIDHTYHAFFTKQTDGKTIPVNAKFMKDAMAIQSQSNNYSDQEIYDLTHDWLQLRTADTKLVLDTVLENTEKQDTGAVFQVIDKNRIGLFGHSLGGATAAELGRMRKDVEAVIVVDGTMIGEEIDFINGQPLLNQDPYPVPLLNIYNEEHFAEASADGQSYVNMVASTHGVDAHQVVFKGSGHLNFTDLPMFSPFLAGMLGIGNIDSRYCIETMNQVILNFFDHYLKGSRKLLIKEQY